MKTWAAAFLNHMQGRTTTLAYGWRVERLDGQPYGFTTYHKAFTLAGLDYLPTSGLDVSGSESTDALSITTIDVTAFLDVSTEAEMLAGLWQGSRITMFYLNYLDIPATFDVTRLNVLRYGSLGRVQIQGLTFRAELRGQLYHYEKSLGRVTTSTCPWELGDATCAANGLNLASFTFAGTVTSVGSNPRLSFGAAALDQPAGIFNLGTLLFTSGANTGLLPWDIRRWQGRVFLLQHPLPFPVTVGDTFTAVYGDNKTFPICSGRFNNARQFGGRLYLPGIDRLLENPLTWEKRPPPPPPPDTNPGNDPPIDGEGSDTDADDDPGEGGPDGGEA